jgi:hypothetical protein
VPTAAAAARPTGRAHMEHTEPPLIATVTTAANRYQRMPASANDSPSTHRAHRKIHARCCGQVW